MKGFNILLIIIAAVLFQFTELRSQERFDLFKPADLNVENYYKFKIENSPKDLCEPQYSTGCSQADGFIDFALAEIENYGSGCDNLNATGWSQYFELGPAFLLQGNTYDCFMSTGYGDQYASIWIDFNDDEELTEDEKVLSNFIMEASGVLYTVPVEIPLNALSGQHLMRARTNWAGGCNDPCTEYQYGEAEDYYVIIGVPAFGTLQGTVTHLSNGSPVADAIIALTGEYNYTITTALDGTYFLDNVLAGEYNAVCSKEGYNSESMDIIIEEDVVMTQNWELTQPTIEVEPLSISVVIEPYATDEVTVTIENNGNGNLDWSASMQISGKNTKDFMDLQFEYPLGIGGGEVGIETDGNFIYTSKWNGADFYKYDLDGTYLGSFSIPGVSAIRDLAYDGNYFYGGNGFSTIYEMDFENQVLISTFIAPTNCRAIAYNEDLDVFYANDWSTPIVMFDKAGNNLGSFNVGPYGEEYYGFAYDNATPGGPFLWGYAQAGDSKNEIIQIQLPSGTETGFTLDIATKLSNTIYNFAGGLFTHANLITGKWTLGGVVQNEWMWGLELTDAQTWLSINPNSGSLAGGASQEVTVVFNTYDLLPAVYNAEIFFTSNPNVGVPVVDVEMTIEGGPFIDNFTATGNCTDILLSWQVFPPGTQADSVQIFRDDEWIATTMETTFNDALVIPETEYNYHITSFFFNGIYSFATDTIVGSVPLPANLEPQNLSYNVVGGELLINWISPPACLTPIGYNIYRDNSFLSYTEDTTYIDSFGFYSYYVTAVYYFGESGASNSLFITDIYENPEPGILIYPNPVTDKIQIVSEQKHLSVVLLDQSGREVMTADTDDGKLELDVAHTIPGIYLLKLQTADGTLIQKTIIN